MSGSPDTADPWTLPAPEVAPSTQRPDIFVVLEESTFDPCVLPQCDITECALPEFFDADARTVASGPLLVHTFGGATYTSEFASLSGLPHTLFGAAGRYAPYKLAPLMRGTLPARLAELGYRSVAIYPIYGEFLKARHAHANYGFDAFHDAAELGLDWGSHDAQVFCRNAARRR
ncbi:MAG: sulfatase-like hydrolase/transferase [Tahibacter sp.]